MVLSRQGTVMSRIDGTNTDSSTAAANASAGVSTAIPTRNLLSKAERETSSSTISTSSSSSFRGSTSSFHGSQRGSTTSVNLRGAELDDTSPTNTSVNGRGDDPTWLKHTGDLLTDDSDQGHGMTLLDEDEPNDDVLGEDTFADDNGNKRCSTDHMHEMFMSMELQELDEITMSMRPGGRQFDPLAKHDEDEEISMIFGWIKRKRESFSGRDHSQQLSEAFIAAFEKKAESKPESTSCSTELSTGNSSANSLAPVIMLSMMKGFFESRIRTFTRNIQFLRTQKST